MRSPTAASLIGAFLLATTFVVAGCWLCPPIWDTNDDISMSMAAHGYGFAAYGSPDIFFSNVLWGYLVRALPTVADTLGYSEASLAALLAVSIAVIYALWRAGANALTCFLALVLALFAPLIMPQFTVNAGLLGVAAVLCMILYANGASRAILIAAGTLAFCGYLVRSLECVLVLGIALPMLPVRQALTDRQARWIVAVFLAAVAIAAVVDHSAYQAPEWKAFTALNPARAPITDYGAGPLLENRPDILERYGYTQGDIELVGGWFFFDPKLADPAALLSMEHDLGWQLFSDPLSSIWDALTSLLDPDLFPLLLAALVLGLLYPSWRLVMVWGIFLAAIALTGLLHRSGMTRVEIPPIMLLLLIPLVSRRPVDRRRYLEMAVLLCCMSFTAFRSYAEWSHEDLNGRYIREQVAADFPAYPVVAWGGSVPFPSLYPVLGSAEVPYKWYFIDVFTLAPYSRPYSDDGSGDSFAQRLVSKAGLPFVLSEDFRGRLKYYCQAHLHGTLQQIPIKNLQVMTVDRYRCATEK